MSVRCIAAAFFVLVAVPAASQAPPEAQTVVVRLSSFRYDPSTIALRQGQAYDLRLENTSSGGHDFAAKEFFAAAQVREDDRSKISNGRIALAGGQSADVHLVAPHAGTYKVRCTHFMHSSFGMTGEIVVQ